MQNLQNYLSESLVPIVAGGAGTVLIALVFGLLRASLKKLRPLAEQTETKIDDVALDVVEEGTGIAERDASNRLGLAITKKK
jgi:hypothetical protein